MAFVRRLIPVLALAGAATLATPSEAHAGGVRVVVEAPRVWVPGHWTVQVGRRVWVAGHYAPAPPPPRVARVWVPGHWVGRGRGRHWVPGHYELR